MNGLSARLLVLTIVFVMLSEALIFAPSIGHFRMTWLEERLNAAHLASLALEATPDAMVDPELTRRLLAHAGALGIEVHTADGGHALMLGPTMPWRADATVDLRDGSYLTLCASLWGLTRTDDRLLKVIGRTRHDGGPLVEILIREAPLRADMQAFAWRILALSLFISAVTAAAVFFTLQWLLVGPLRRLTASMTAFRERPEDGGRVIRPSGRGDEVGVAEKALAEMQRDLRANLTQRARLAAVGEGVTKIQHDLRGILSSAMVVSERLETSGDPEVRRITPTIIGAIDRAVAMCTRTMAYAREGLPDIRLGRLPLLPLVEEVGKSVAAGTKEPFEWRSDIDPALMVTADGCHLSRALENLGRNAAEAGARKVTVSAIARDGRVDIRVADDGPGLPLRARDNLFTPFAGSAKAGGTGLGLPIARELMLAQGGGIELSSSSAQGTVFRLDLPG